jgi:XTP/dITP diphosphohydrolase
VYARLIAATTNLHKLREIRRVLADVPVEIASLADLPAIPEPDETGLTFQENARLKALYYSQQLGAARGAALVVAEDSGLVVDALGGEPGVRSARFLRDDASYQERFAEIYRRLAERPGEPRTARFVCALAAVDGERIVFETTGTVEGEIGDRPGGSGGFGYDPIFYYPPYDCTLAEVDGAKKAAVSHRGKAFKQLRNFLESSQLAQ